MSDLLLRFPEPRDAEAVYAAVRESLPELHAWMSWCGMDYSLGDAERWVEMQSRARETGAAFEFLIVDGAGRMLGCCGVNQISAAYRLANFGYWVRTSMAGRGVATAAGRQLVDWAFLQTDLERLEIVAAVGNRASQAVAAKLGALREGVLRSRLLVHGRFQDAVLFSILRTDSRVAAAASGAAGGSKSGARAAVS